MTAPATVLLAADPELASALVPHLEGCGWRVVYAPDGGEAARVATAEGFDVAVVDMLLPRASGFHFTRTVRAQFGPAVPVVMVSDFDSPDHRAYAAAVGVSHFLAEPFQLEALLKLIADSLK